MGAAHFLGNVNVNAPTEISLVDCAPGRSCFEHMSRVLSYLTCVQVRLVGVSEGVYDCFGGKACCGLELACRWQRDIW
jgi:hypothetical protein